MGDNTFVFFGIGISSGSSPRLAASPHAQRLDNPFELVGASVSKLVGSSETELVGSSLYY